MVGSSSSVELGGGLRRESNGNNLSLSTAKYLSPLSGWYVIRGKCLTSPHKAGPRGFCKQYHVFLSGGKGDLSTCRVSESMLVQ
jgi:hypothetical protein